VARESLLLPSLGAKSCNLLFKRNKLHCAFPAFSSLAQKLQFVAAVLVQNSTMSQRLGSTATTVA
jgi:hypothetical protein